MNNNIKKIFLLTTVILLFIGLSTISATDSSADNTTLSTNDNIEESTISADANAIADYKDNNINKQYAKEDKNIKKDSTTENRININNENIGEYFEVSDFQAYSLDTIGDNTIIQLDEAVDVNFWIFSTDVSDITFTTKDNMTLTNNIFSIETSNFTFANISLAYDSDREEPTTISITGDGFKIINSYLYYDSDILGDGNVNTLLLLNANHATISDSTFRCNIPSSNVDWNETSPNKGFPKTMPMIVRGDYINITGNTITVTERGIAEEGYPTFYGTYINGHNINFTENNVSLVGSNGYVYAVYLSSSRETPNYNITVSDNNIQAESQHNYSAGLYIDGSHYQNITVINNNITATTNTEYKEDDGVSTLQDVAYTVVITDYAYTGGTYTKGNGNVTNNKIINNRITAIGHQSYGIEQYGGDNTLIAGNTITAEGSRAQAIGLIGFNSTIRDNSLTAVGDSPLGEGSPDYVPPITAGIHTLRSSNNSIYNNTIDSTSARGIYIRDFNNTITDNTVFVHDYEFSVELLNGTYGNVIEGNLLITDDTNGSRTIFDNGLDNYIGNNSDETELIPTHLYPDDVVTTFDEEFELFITVENDGEEEYEFEGESVQLYANGELIASEEIWFTFVSFYYTTPLSWYKNITLVAKYPGNEEYAPSEATINLTINIPTSIDAADVINAGLNDHITAGVVDIMNNTVDAASIDVYQDDEFISELSNYTVTESGNYNITLVFEGGLLSDGYTYNASQKDVTINVNASKRQANMTVESVQTSIGEVATITAHIYDLTNSSTVINDGIVEFAIDNGTMVMVASVVNSTAILQLPFDTTGVYDVIATFKNSSNYETATATATVTVTGEKIPVTTYIETVDEIYLGDNLTINATILGDNSTVSNVSVDLYCNDEYIDSLVSNIYGQISYDYAPAAAGNYTFKLHVNDEYYTANDTTKTVTVKRNCIPVNISLDLDGTGLVGDDVEIIVMVEDEDEYSVSGVNMDLYCNNDLITSLESDEEGMIFYSYTPTAAGNYTFTLKVTDEDYTSDDTSDTYTVTKRPTAISIISDDMITEGETLVITVNVEDLNDGTTDINNGIVEVTADNGTIVMVANVVNSIATVQLSFNTTGTYDIIATFKNSTIYEDAFNTTQVTVNKNIIPVNILMELDEEYEIGEAVYVSALVNDDNWDGVAGVNVDLYYDDTFVASVVSDEEGWISYNYIPTTAGEHTITLKVNDDNYIANDTSATFTVTKKQSRIVIVSEDTVILGEPLLITVNVYDLTNEAMVNDGIVEFAADGSILAVVGVENATATVQLTFNTTGEHIITATFKNSTVYEDSLNTTLVIVNRNIVPVNILMELDDEYELGDTVDIMANIVDDNYDNIAGVTIDLYINDELVTSAVSDDEGMVYYTYTPTAVGDYNITLSFDGNEVLLPSTINATITVNKRIIPVFVSVDELGAEYELGSDVEVVAVVRDVDDNVVAGVNVDLYVGDELVSSAVSNDSGLLYYVYTPSAVGNYTLIFRVNDDDFTGDDYRVDFSVYRIIPVSILIELDDEYELGDTVDIMANIVDENYDNIAGVTIDLYIDNVFVTSLVSDEEGCISYNYTPTTAGEHTITLKVNDENYMANDTSVTFTVTKIATITSVAVLNNTLGNVIIGVTVTDTTNKSISLGSVIVTDATGNIIADVTLGDSPLTITIPANTTGQMQITVTYQENDYYLESVNNITIDIPKLASSISIEALPDTVTLAESVNISGKVFDENGNLVNEGEIELTINGNVYVLNLVDGEYVLEFVPFEAATYYANATFLENDMILSSTSDTISFTVNKIATLTRVEIINNTAGNVTINVVITDASNQTVTTGDININIADNNETITITSSDTTVTPDITSAGQFTGLVQYLENNEYMASEEIINFTVVMPTSIQSEDTINTLVNNNITITANVIDMMNNIVDTANIDVYEDGVFISEISNYTFVPTASGNYTIRLVFEGGLLSDGYTYLPSEKEITITAEKRQIAMTVEDIETIEGEATLISAQLSDAIDENMSINTGIVEFTDEHDNILASANVENSTATVQITFNTTGQQNIRATFKDSDVYETVTATLTVTVNKKIIPVVISLELDDEYELGESVEITALVEDENIQTVSGVNVDLYCNDEYLTTLISNENGWIVYEYNPTEVGNYTITIRVNDEDYIGNDTTATFTVVHTIVPVTVELDAVDEAFMGDMITLTARVTDGDNSTVSGVNIDWYCNDELMISLVTDEDGQSLYTFTSYVTGNYTFTVKVNDDDYTADDVTKTVIVNKRIIPLVISLELDEEYEYGESVEITALVEDDNVQTVSGVNVDLYCNDEYITTLVSDEEGWIIYEYTPEIPGDYVITLRVNDDDFIANDTTATFTVLQPPKDYSLQVVTTNFTIGETATIQANIYYGNQFEQDIAANITKGKVTFKVNGKTLKDENGKVIYAKVVNGTATINYTIPESWYNENITIEAAYSGSTQLDTIKSNKTQLNILKPKASITTQDITATPGSTINLTATINDEDKVINTGKVVFKINGKSLKDESGKVIYAQVKDNVASILYTVPSSYKAKDYTLTAVFTSSEYERMEDTKTLTVTN